MKSLSKNIFPFVSSHWIIGVRWDVVVWSLPFFSLLYETDPFSRSKQIRKLSLIFNTKTVIDI